MSGEPLLQEKAFVPQRGDRRANENAVDAGSDDADGTISKSSHYPSKSRLPLCSEKAAHTNYCSSGGIDEDTTHDEQICSEDAVAVSCKPSSPLVAANSTPSEQHVRLPVENNTPHGQDNGVWSELIDNSTRVYLSFKLKCGVTVQVGKNVLETCPQILEVLNHDLIGCLFVLPASIRKLVRRTKIWVNQTYSYGPLCNPKTVNHTTAHHFAGWLLCVRDNPAKEESIEIYNALEYQKMRLHYNGCGLLLHELCHIIHQKTLPGGLNNAMVIEIHKKAQESRKYSKVLRRDWALKDFDTDMAYCIVNHKEFFAEISVSYLADFYHDVDGAGTTVMARCSPPFVAPPVIERIYQRAIEDQVGKPQIEGRQIMLSSTYRVMAKTDMVLPHCNKFFPFTKGQLRRYDPRVFTCFAKLWQFIEGWEDNEGRQCGRCSSFDWC